MAEGTVKWFDIELSYGFISQTDGKDVFVHVNDILMQDNKYKILYADDKVEFDIEDNLKGLKAKNVKVITNNQ